MMSAMAESDPRPVIIEYLTRPSAGRPFVGAEVAAYVRTGPTARVVTGGLATADPASIEFVKARGTNERQLFAMTFDDQDNRSWFALLAVERDADGGPWIPHDVAVGSGEIPQRSSPWLNLAAQWGQGRLYAGGQIHTAGATLSKVRLTLEDDSELEDDAEGNVALFVAEHDAAPASVTIYDTDGQPLTTHNP
jgi:hypothetical protein